jgi:hypothetical protein
MVNSDARRLVTCWHEAGHAVTATLLGHQPGPVTVIPNDTGNGCAFHRWTAGDFGDVDSWFDQPVVLWPAAVRQLFETNAVIAMAGRIAESLIPDGAGVDADRSRTSSTRIPTTTGPGRPDSRQPRNTTSRPRRRGHPLGSAPTPNSPRITRGCYSGWPSGAPGNMRAGWPRRPERCSPATAARWSGSPARSWSTGSWAASTCGAWQARLTPRRGPAAPRPACPATRRDRPPQATCACTSW